MNSPRDEYEKRIREAFLFFESPEKQHESEKPNRWQDDVIVDLIPPGSKVLDFGCGSGELLSRLIREKKFSVRESNMIPKMFFVVSSAKLPFFRSTLKKDFSFTETERLTM